MEAYRLQANFMQRAFISNLLELREQKVDKALLISATGTHVILMTGRKALKNKDFGPVFSFG